MDRKKKSGITIGGIVTLAIVTGGAHHYMKCRGVYDVVSDTFVSASKFINKIKGFK